MKIRPLHDRVIVKREEEERKSPGGIVIPDTATEKPIFGKVIAVGKGKILENGEIRPLDVKVGDKILFGKYSGTEVKMDGDELVCMREEDIMAVVVPSPASSEVLEATSLSICAPMFSNLSLSSISFATETPSLVMIGAP